MTDLSERRLTHVGLEGLRNVTLPDGSPGIEGTVTLRLSDEEGGENGPLATVSLAVPAEHDDAEQSILEGALAAFQRLSRESGEELAVLLKMFAKTRG